jgi:repressor LexA
MENLTQSQQQALDFISRCIETNGAPPTLREISAHFGTSGTVTALCHVEAIEKKGFLSRMEGSARGIVALIDDAALHYRQTPENHTEL